MAQSPLFQQFVAAITADNDEQTEQIVTQMTSSDEPTLLDWLQTADANGRWWAVRALAVCGTNAALPHLLDTLADPDPALRAVTALTLGALYRREADAIAPLLDTLANRLTDDDGMVRQAVADALAQCGDAAVPALARILQGSHGGARTRAAYALRKIATMPAAGVLYRHLNDANYMVHLYAHEGLDEMGLLENILVAV